MSSQSAPPDPTRTAIIVVHGMGRHRPTETARGLVEAVWIDKDGTKQRDRDESKPGGGDESKPGSKRFWLHPERTGDLDLPVFTSNSLFPADSGKRRTFDFHELYWAHLMSGTKPVAVLLWLFELARRGPRLGPELKWVWWGGAIFLAALVLSFSFLALHLIERLSAIPKIERHAMIFSPLVLVALALVFAFLVATFKERTLNFAVLAICALMALFGAIAAIVFVGVLLETIHVPNPHSLPALSWLPFHVPDLRSLPVLNWLGSCLETHIDQPYTLKDAIGTLVTLMLPLSVSLVAARILMGPILPLLILYAGSWVGFVLYYLYHHRAHGSDAATALLCNREVPWSLDSPWSAITAWTILGLYLLLNAVFLQPYLGDAARYFRVSPANVAGQRQIRREAVQLLEDLHLSGKYDRIIVVAHSLGTVIAYDMLRAYFSRICGQLPATAEELKDNITAIDQIRPEEANELRRRGREIVRTLARLASEKAAKVQLEEEKRKEWAKAWLVTDFITLGSPLHHAVYLTSQGNEFKSIRQQGFSDADALKAIFEQRQEERQFPTCPPTITEGDARLTFLYARTNERRFHHGALFGLTRWTNLYFPVSQLLWGDAIGGELKDVFGEGVIDVKVYTCEPPAYEPFAHSRYWDIGPNKNRDLPHIVMLKRAINLEDNDAITREQADKSVQEADHAETSSAKGMPVPPPSPESACGRKDENA
jgi:hypothetical protein